MDMNAIEEAYTSGHEAMDSLMATATATADTLLNGLPDHPAIQEMRAQFLDDVRTAAYNFGMGVLVHSTQELLAHVLS